MACFISLLLIGLACIVSHTCRAVGEPKFPAILVFGDSTVDPGNNDYIKTVFRSNHTPYGMNLANPTAATGRFSDGLIVTDYLASGLGIKQLVPPFLDPSIGDEDIVTGVSFASAGSGYDELTTAASGVIPVSKQPELFKLYLDKIEGIAGKERGCEIARGSLYLISAGTNDFVYNYYDIPTRKGKYTIGGYQDFLQQKLLTLIQELYKLGARKFAIAGLPPVGCIPLQITTNLELKNRKCIANQNTDSMQYNAKLQSFISQTQDSLPGIRIAYLNIYDPLMDMINNPQKYGFEITDRGCCGSGLVEVGPLCNSLTPPCDDVSKYLFWDAVHPSQRTCEAVALYQLRESLPALY